MNHQAGKWAFAAKLGAFALGCAAAFGAAAQSWPAKPVKVVVNFPPGGAADQIARAITGPLQEVLGQPVVVENKGGAGGNIGGEAVARSAPDGYTLLMSSGGMVSVNPFIYPKMSFDPIKDLAPVAAAAKVKVFLVTQPGKLPADIKSFIAYLKANPGKLSYGTPGNGSSPHLAAEMFQSQAGVSAVHVPYRGAAPALVDLLAGQIDFAFDPGIAMQHVQSGKLNMLAVGSLTRSPLFPNVPTLDEAGLKGFDADTVFGFYAPAGTPKEIIGKLNTEINKIVGTPAFRERLVAMGGDPAPMTPEQFHARVEEDARRFGAIIRERKIVGD
ncbi:MAG: tripartite tricarboxylate transporter substrate binding protein [Pigmentiphaga sp.]|uniref:Bug family tripartite tricarboxylate transporter substrate binding protein n=1 Tax=Pigmentiphaga sp. TaxID=1977564 RepID=UPI0029A2AABE|nr:tripartite tricarboxylate transporter substrate binding protein [Pigmentiphaga sp.]MDX3906727.1 tripartite tricarboxylate transporter substrate binding protein [Pigmentiphaga sp.]